MNHGGRIALLGCSVVLLIVGIVCLRQQVGPTHAPPAFVPAGDTSDDAPAMSTRRQPTILTADPSSGLGHPTAPSWPELEAVPIPDLDSTLNPTFPIQHELPVASIPELNEPPRSADSLFPSDDEPEAASRTPRPAAGAEVREPLGTDTTFVTPGKSASLGEPRVLAPEATRPVTQPQRAAVTTQNDSLWRISERVYGSGLYYQALFALNRARIARPDRIESGIELATPPVEDLRRMYPDLCPTAPIAGIAPRRVTVPSQE